VPYALLIPFGLVAFVVYLIAGVAETNRAPFDLPEAEGELGAGFHTEYSGFKWSMFFMAEYVNMINISALAIVLFLGGWWPAVGGAGGVLGPIVFVLKLALFIFFFIWLRSTLPRLRYDRLMGLGWKVLFPLALGNLIVTAVIVALWPAGVWPFV
jgi:NADH-quinone oxidoreductase subunit H